MKAQTLPNIRFEMDAVEAPLPTSISGAALTIFAVIFVGLAGALAWSATAPIASGAVAKGHLIVESRRKTISHLEGGIVKRILVNDGEFVKAGQVLVQLDDSRLNLTRAIYRDRWDQDRALESRLTAERDGRTTIDFPSDLAARANTDSAVADILNAQRRQFTVRRQTEEGKDALLRQRIGEVREQIGGLEAQVKSRLVQMGLIADELQGVRELYAKGLAPKPRLLELERSSEDIVGSRATAEAQIAADKVTIGEAEMQIIENRKSFDQDVIEQLRQVTADRLDAKDRMETVEEQMTRLEIRSPSAGQVVGLLVHTVGGSIGAGEKLMYIVPGGDRLVIEAEIAPTEIEHVRVGLPAEVRLSVLRQRTTPTLEGTVTSLSSDVVEEADQRGAYYTAQVEIPREQLGRLEGAKLVAGMPAEVLIKEGEHTVISYVVGPIRDAIFRSFHQD